MTILRIARLGLRQFAAGMLSVLTLGILNRVMKIELGLNLALTSVVLAAHYFAAVVAIPLGHRSDRAAWRGYHRTPYIAGGTLVTALATLLAPFAVLFMADQAVSPLAASLTVALFLVMGAGMYVAGTAYLSLITDLTSEHERGRVVAITWAMMMLGILAGVFLGIGVMEFYSPEHLALLFALMSGLLVGLTALALWRQEVPRREVTSEAALSLPRSLCLLTISRQTRLFFTFLAGGIFFLFMQQTALEPFGGDVFGLDIQQTTLFNAYQMVGVLVGMGLTGSWLARRLGKKRSTALGALLASLAFAALAASAVAGSLALVRPAILLLGLGMGIFTVGGLALMLDLTVKEQVGLFMGAWTLAQALANGLASVGGGLAHDAGLALFGSEPGAYALVFAAEAAGLLAMLGLLVRVDVARFRSEIGEFAWRLLEESG